MAPRFREVLEEYGLTKKTVAYIKDDEEDDGGNLNTMARVLDTPYAPRFRGNHGVTAFWRGIYGVSTG
jgi:5-bromo-4-chloroindolyl phosphate hydrolysis protein